MGKTNQDSQIIVYSKYFEKLEDAYKKTNQPIIVVGPIDCGKQTSVKQLCVKYGKVPYVVSETSKVDELLGFLDVNGDYKASPLFTAYVTGQVFYVENVRKITNKFLDAMKMIQESKKMSFPCGEVEQGDGFRIIVSTTSIPTSCELAISNSFSRINFDYDSDLESMICLDVEVYMLLSDMREIAKKCKLNLDITTATFVNVAKMKSVDMVKDLTILQSIVAPLSKEEKTILYQGLQQKRTNENYLLMLSALI